jgi:hypothetical protein
MPDVARGFEDLQERYRHTRSFRLFAHSLHQNRELLKHAAAGLNEGLKISPEIANRIEAALAGEPISEEYPPETQTVEISLSHDDWSLIKYALEHQQDHKNTLHIYLHNVLLVALWGGFESYLQGIIAQIFEINVDELASERQLSYRDIIEHQASPINYLIEREVNDFGHLSLAAMLRYINSRIKYSFSESQVAALQDLYLLRNIIAHNSGFVRPSQRQLIPKEVSIKDNQIEVSLEYLKIKMGDVEFALNAMDTYVIQRWKVPMFTGGLFDDAPGIA